MLVAPKLRIPRSEHSTPGRLLCETVHAADLQGLAQPAPQRPSPPRRDVTAAHPWSNSEHFRCCPRTCRPLRDIMTEVRISSLCERPCTGIEDTPEASIGTGGRGEQRYRK